MRNSVRQSAQTAPRLAGDEVAADSQKRDAKQPSNGRAAAGRGDADFPEHGERGSEDAERDQERIGRREPHVRIGTPAPQQLLARAQVKLQLGRRIHVAHYGGFVQVPGETRPDS